MNTALRLTLPFLFFLCLTAAGRTEEQPMPDTLTFKADAPLPEGITTRKVPCYIIDESAQEYTVDFSRWKGIVQAAKIPKSSIEGVEHGDSSERDYLQIKSILTPPPNAIDLASYESKYSAPLRAYLQKHNGSPLASVVRDALKAQEPDLALMQNGLVRVGNIKLSPGDLTKDDAADWQLWLLLNSQGTGQSLDVFSAECKQIVSSSQKLLYPLLIDTINVLSRQRIADLENKIASLNDANIQKRQELVSALEEEKANAVTLPHPDLSGCQQAIPSYFLAVYFLKKNPPDIPQTCENLRTALAKWPNLSSAIALADDFILKGLDLSAGTIKAGKYRDAAKILEIILPLSEFSKTNTHDSLQAKIASLYEQAEHEELISKIETALKTYDLAAAETALTDCAKFLSAHTQTDNRLTDLKKKLEQLKQEKNAQTIKTQLASVKNNMAAGKCGQAFDDLDQLKPLLADTQFREVSSLYLDLGVASLKRFSPITAFEAFTTAKDVDPSFTKAKYAFVAAWGGLVLALCAGLLGLLICYAFVSNLLHGQRFRIRLNALRSESSRKGKRKRRAIG